MSVHHLEAGGIIKYFGKQKVLSDVYLSCKTGEIIGLLGRNGSGKSTLLKIIFGSVDTQDKHISVDGQVHAFEFQAKRLVSYLPQQGFLPNLRLRKLVKLYIDAPEKRLSLLEDNRIEGLLEKRVEELSGGERRYVEILLLLHLDTKFLLLDEPFNGIEPIYRNHIRNLLETNKKHKGFIITDHDYRNVMAVSDKLVLIQNGLCKTVNRPEELEVYNYLAPGTLSQSDVLDSSEMPEQGVVEEHFEIDNQTYRDLSLTFDHEELFSLFVLPESNGGRAFLEKLVKSPSNNLRVLEQRSQLIQYIGKEQIDFQTCKKRLNFVEYYLSSGIIISRTTYVEALWDLLKDRFRSSNDRYIIEEGIKKTIELLEDFQRLIDTYQKTWVPQYLAHLLYQAEEIISGREMRNALQDANHALFQFCQAKIDLNFRKKLKTELFHLLGIMYELETYQAVAATAAKYCFHFPKYVNAREPQLMLKGLFHPLLRKPVSNDFEMNSTQSLCFLTGSNMSGKSTFLKSLGISVYLAHLGFPVPAKEMTTTVFNGLITTINLSDDIHRGYSHFSSEVKRVKEASMVLKKYNRMIVIFDELFKGTNIKDATDASLVIASAFAKINGSFFLVSTHITELAERLAEYPTVFFNCLDTNLKGDELVNDFKLKKGVSENKIGMFIIRKEKIPELLDEIIHSCKN